MQQKPYSESLILACTLQQFYVKVFYPSFGGFPLPQAGIFILLSFFLFFSPFFFPWLCVGKEEVEVVC